MRRNAILFVFLQIYFFASLLVTDVSWRVRIACGSSPGMFHRLKVRQRTAADFPPAIATLKKLNRACVGGDLSTR